MFEVGMYAMPVNFGEKLLKSCKLQYSSDVESTPSFDYSSITKYAVIIIPLLNYTWRSHVLESLAATSVPWKYLPSLTVLAT